jgi:hypothetical protein
MYEIFPTCQTQHVDVQHQKILVVNVIVNCKVNAFAMLPVDVTHQFVKTTKKK